MIGINEPKKDSKEKKDLYDQVEELASERLQQLIDEYGGELVQQAVNVAIEKIGKTQSRG